MSCNNNLFLYSEAWLDSTGKKYFLIGSSVDGVKDEIGMEQGYPNVHFFIGNIPHSEHVMSANMKARALINSPSKLQQTPWRV